MKTIVTVLVATVFVAVAGLGRAQVRGGGETADGETALAGYWVIAVPPIAHGKVRDVPRASWLIAPGTDTTLAGCIKRRGAIITEAEKNAAAAPALGVHGAELHQAVARAWELAHCDLSDGGPNFHWPKESPPWLEIAASVPPRTDAEHAPGATGSSESGAGSAVAGLLLIALLLCLASSVYFLPTIVAAARRHHNSGAIFLLNFFLGWTFIGWVIALVWAATAVQPTFADAAPRAHTH